MKQVVPQRLSRGTAFWSGISFVFSKLVGLISETLRLVEADGNLSAEVEQAQDGLRQPDQMTKEWWELHYSEILDGYVMNDPRVPGDPEKFEVFGNDLNDRDHFEVAVAYIEALVSPLVEKSHVSHRTWNVLVLGCGLSPLVFAMADRSLGNVSCLEISITLVDRLQAIAASLPKPPQFFVGDITTIHTQQHLRAEKDAGREDIDAGSMLARGSFHLVVDENVLDGMAGTFPLEKGQLQQQSVLEGIEWLLDPNGLLLSISFLPLVQSDSIEGHFNPFAVALERWPSVSVQELRQAEGQASKRPLLYASVFKKPQMKIEEL